MRSVATAICNYEKIHWEDNYVNQVVNGVYRRAILTGLSMGADDWGRDLPSVVEQYISRVGCEKIVETFA